MWQEEPKSRIHALSGVMHLNIKRKILHLSLFAMLKDWYFYS